MYRSCVVLFANDPLSAGFGVNASPAAHQNCQTCQTCPTCQTKCRTITPVRRSGYTKRDTPQTAVVLLANDPLSAGFGVNALLDTDEYGCLRMSTE